MIIVDSKWLASHLDDLNLVIIDTRDNITYRFRQWHKAGLPTTRQIPTQKPSTSLFKSKINCTIRADAEIIKAKQSDPNVIIVDARTAQEHFQARIPGSILHNWEEGLDDDSGRVIRYKDELQKDFEQRGITKDKEIICYCHSGTRASHKYLQLKEAGFNNVRMYDGSIIDWAQRHNPLR